MKITRSLTVNKINVICYDPENKCEFCTGSWFDRGYY